VNAIVTAVVACALVFYHDSLFAEQAQIQVSATLIQAPPRVDTLISAACVDDVQSDSCLDSLQQDNCLFYRSMDSTQDGIVQIVVVCE
jgi:hypothetical protein